MATTTATKEAVRAALAPIAADMAEVERVIAEEMSSSVARVQESGATSRRRAANACARRFSS